MRTSLLTIAAVLLVVGVFWLAGEQHVQNCQDAAKNGCSLLPWSGTARAEPALTPAEQRALRRARGVR